jgi:restriction system protein
MKRYCRIILGRGHAFASECREQSFVGVNFDFDMDLTGKFPEDWREFNKKYVPYLMENGYKSKVSAGLACGMTWTLCYGLNPGDIVICPSGNHSYYVGVINSPYVYAPGSNLQHRRSVRWLEIELSPDDFSSGLKNSIYSIGTTCVLDSHVEELTMLIGEQSEHDYPPMHGSYEDVTEGILERHLEEFLVRNWEKTPFANEYNIYRNEEGEVIGQQFSAFGLDRIDILAESKDKKKLLVIELKKDRGTDETVGQLLRYMGYVNTIKDEGQTVQGMIIAHEGNERIEHALSMVPNVEFYAYKLQFSLTKLS